MPLKEGACVVCNDTKRCSVCKGKRKILKEGKEAMCKACGGSGKCAHCIYKHSYGGWTCW